METPKVEFNSLMTEVGGDLISSKLEYETQSDGYILIVKNVIQNPKKLTDTLNAMVGWRDATIANSAEVYVNTDHRSSLNMSIPPMLPLAKYLDNLAENVKNLYCKLNPFARVSKHTGFEALKYEIGKGFANHIDVIDGHPSWGQRKLTVLFYPNQDYEGGELEFTRQGLLYKPDAGDALVFPSGFTYPHASLKVKCGYKLAIVTWYI